MRLIHTIFFLTFFFTGLLAQPQFYSSDYASIDFEYESFNFGEITEGDVVVHEFEFVNRSSQPLVLSDVRSTCGCTVPNWSREPIEPGARGAITVQFDSKGKRGDRNQKVTITANTDPAQSFIYLTGTVQMLAMETITDPIYLESPPPPPPSTGLSVSGPTTTMEFETETFHFGEILEGEVVTHVFSFTNTGDEPLIVSDARGSCGCTVPAKPTAPILPGETSSITVQFNSQGKRGDRNQKVTVTANTNPPQTFLYLKGYIIPGTEENTPDFQPVTEEAETALSADCFALFPNPTTDFLRLKVEPETEGKPAEVAIYSKMGQLMARREVEAIYGNIEFEVSHYPAGEYIAYVRIGDSEPEARCFMVVD